jgi:hypothetical protein
MNKKAYALLYLFMLILMIFMFILIYNFAFAEHFQNNNDNKKTLCLIWSDNDKKQNGLGDSIRGLISLQQFCKKQKYSFIFDCRESSISRFMTHLTTALLLEPHIQPISYEDNSEMIYLYDDLKITPHETDILIDKFKTTNFIKLYSQIYHTYEVTEELVNLMNYIFEPTPEIKQEVDRIKKTLPQNYGIQHARFNDNVLENDITINDSRLMKQFEYVKNTIQPTDVLISNSLNFKKYVKQQMNIVTITSEDNIERKISHITLSDLNEEGYKNTIIEFLILRDAKYINSYTEYSWCSNFTSHIAKIYNIPYNCQMNI